jgi:predicted TIM-barrel fold metal-dependent hydrolase
MDAGGVDRAILSLTSPGAQPLPADIARVQATLANDQLSEACNVFCREVLGPDRVMYAMDYPYEYSIDEVRWQDDLPLTVAEKKQFYQTNAEAVFGLPTA